MKRLNIFLKNAGSLETLDRIKIIYNPDFTVEQVKIMSIFKYTIRQIRNLVKSGKKVEQIDVGNLHNTYYRKFFYNNPYYLLLSRDVFSCRS